MDGTIIADLVGKVTRKWAKQRKAEERNANAQWNRRQAMARSYRTTLKDVVNDHIEAAYLAVSSNNKLPAHARQIMYDVRRRIQGHTDETLDDKYFTQNLLPAFVLNNQETASGWNVVFDARGHHTEPHTKVEVALGTLAVRKHLLGSAGTDDAAYNPADLYPTHGPQHRYGAILFLEKEGFMPLIQEVKLAERFDIGIMSTKGLSNIASRQLVDHLCGKNNIPLFALRDFDKAGFSIVSTLSKSSARYQFKHKIRVFDLGLRLEDVEKWGLDSESFCTKSSKYSIRRNLLRNGATEEEAEFIANLKRVELNAFPSADLVKFIEGKLIEHGVKKIIPDAATQEAAFRRSLRNEFIQHRFGELKTEARVYVDWAKVPSLERKITKILKTNPELPWDEAVRQIAAKAFVADGGPGKGR